MGQPLICYGLVAISILLSGQSLAVDLDKLTSLGFSSDGQYFAFMTSGSQQGSGAPHAEMTFIDVVKNKYARDRLMRFIPAHDYNGHETRQEIENLLLSSARSTLEKFGISSKLKGEKLGIKRLAPASESIDEVIFTLPGAHSDSIFTLTLSTINAPEQKTSRMCAMGVKVVPKRLRMTIHANPDKKERVLQADRLSHGRECVKRFEIGELYLFNDAKSPKLIAMVQVISAGFEGEDSTRYMAISGALNR